METELTKKLDRIITLLQVNQTQWLSTEQACAYLHICRANLEKMIKLELIQPYYLLKGKRLFRLKDLDSLPQTRNRDRQRGRKRTLTLKVLRKEA